MRVVIIDDEKAMLLIMKRMLAKIAGVDVMACFQDTAAAFAYLEKHSVDMLFVDIGMPYENGLDFARRLLSCGYRGRVVFVTSHKEYALDAFDVYAYDYIVKPVSLERLEKTIRRASQENALRVLPTVKSLTAPVTVSCLGGLEIYSEQGGMVKWISSKSAEIFCYLLLHKGRQVSRGRLLEDIFAGMPQRNAETYLNTAVYQLRKSLEAHGLKGSVQSDSNHYALHLGYVNIDMSRFEEGCKRLAIIDDSNLEQALELEQLYAGDLFGDRVFPWAWSEIERLSQLYTNFARRLCDALLACGDAAAAIRLLTKLIKRNDLDEASNMLLLQALAMQKNKRAVTRQYVQYADHLRKEIGIHPSSTMNALYKQLLMELNSNGTDKGC